MDMFPFFFSGRRRGFGSGRSKKSKKKPKDNWFERLKADELKQICRAAKLPIKGTKKDIIARLLEYDGTSKYGAEGKWIGATVDSLKAECKVRSLIQSGTKLTLVVRIVEHDHGSNPESTAAAKKRPAPSDDGADGSATKKRKKAPPRPKPEKIYAKVQKKVESVRQKKYQTHWGSKSHASDVYSFIAHTIFDNEIENKGYIEKEPLFALELAKSALTSLSDNWSTMERPGYDEDYIQCFSSSLEKTVETCISKNLLDDEKKIETLEWVEELDSKLEPFGLGCDYGGCSNGNSRFLQQVADILRPKEEDDSIDEQDKKCNPLEVTVIEGKNTSSSSEDGKENVGHNESIDKNQKCTTCESTDRQQTVDNSNHAGTKVFKPTASKEHNANDENTTFAPIKVSKEKRLEGDALGTIGLKRTPTDKENFHPNNDEDRIETTPVEVGGDKNSGE